MAIPAKAQDELSPFVHSNAVHTLYHELAHALIDQFQIPVLGQEEDAADNFATLELVRMFGPDAKPMIADVATAWLMLHADEDSEDLDFYDTHDLNAQRAYRAVCMYYGLDTFENLDVAEWAELPEDLHDVCEEIALVTRDNWEIVLADALLPETGPEADVSLVFGPPQQNNVLKVKLERSGLLQDFVADIKTSFNWPAPITVKAWTCNEPNAFWDPETRSIEFCYEILGEWMSQERRDTRPNDARFRSGATVEIQSKSSAPVKNVRE